MARTDWGLARLGSRGGQGVWLPDGGILLSLCHWGEVAHVSRSSFPTVDAEPWRRGDSLSALGAGMGRNPVSCVR